MKTFSQWLTERITGIYPLGYGGLGLYPKQALQPGNPYVDASLKIAKKKNKKKGKKKKKKKRS
jgi:hypothetical protein